MLQESASILYYSGSKDSGREGMALCWLALDTGNGRAFLANGKLHVDSLKGSTPDSVLFHSVPIKCQVTTSRQTGMQAQQYLLGCDLVTGSVQANPPGASKSFVGFPCHPESSGATQPRPSL